MPIKVIPNVNSPNFTLYMWEAEPSGSIAPIMLVKPGADYVP
jgi:hypothetical protein